MAKARRYLALLRGINVGGKNIIRMSDLKTCFESFGCADVATYIASGNVLFRSGEGRAALEKRVEGELSRRFGYNARIVLLTDNELADIVAQAPRGFGTKPKELRYDVVFLKTPLTPATAAKDVVPKEGVDAVYQGPGVLYTTRLVSRASESRLAKITALPSYRYMTVRNWNTTTKLNAMISK